MREWEENKALGKRATENPSSVVCGHVRKRERERERKRERGI